MCYQKLKSMEQCEVNDFQFMSEDMCFIEVCPRNNDTQSDPNNKRSVLLNLNFEKLDYYHYYPILSGLCDTVSLLVRSKKNDTFIYLKTITFTVFILPVTVSIILKDNNKKLTLF